MKRTGLLVIALVTFAAVAQAAPITIGQWTGSARSWNAGDFSTIKATMTGAGHTVEADEAISAANLSNNAMFVIGEPTVGLTAGGTTDLANWLSAGGILWFGVDSASSTAIANGILTGLGSAMSIGATIGNYDAPLAGGVFASTGPPFNLVGLVASLSNPGAIFPGVAGAICLILAFYALQTLPINYAGLMLIILAIGLFIAEAFIASHGVLGVGGAVAMLFGSLMLIDSPEPSLQISWAVILPVVAASSLLCIVTVTVAVRAHRGRVDTGKEGLIGMHAEAKTEIGEDGQVFLRGEYWNAESDDHIAKGEKVMVVSVDGLRLKVRKVV